MNGRTAKLLATVGVVVAGVTFIVYSAMSDSQPQKDADDLLAEWHGGERETILKKSMGVHGFVEAGSIKTEVIGQKTRREFIVAFNDGRVRVRHEGPVPDTFREGAEVVAKGKIVEENGAPVFVARELMAKCPSKYEGGSPQGYNGGGEKPVFEE